MTRVVVVGAGIGGLAAAARLADLGHAVTVLEQAASVGGQVGVYSRDGFSFDTGPTTLTLPAVYRDLFRTTGRPLERELDLTPVEPAWHVRFADGVELDLPNASRARTLQELRAVFGPESAAEWDAMLRHGERIWRAVRRSHVEANPAHGLRRLTTGPGRLRKPGAGRSLRAAAARSLHDARLRDLLEGKALHAGLDPRRAPAIFLAVPYVEHTFGTWYVPGGMRRLAEAVADRAVARGARLRTSADVVQVLVTDGRAAGVRLAGGEGVPADVVVADVQSAQVHSALLDPSAARTDGRRSAPALPPSVFTVLLALRGRTPSLRHRTILFPADDDAELEAVFGRDARPADEPTIHVSAPDDPAMRPSAETEAWTVHVRAPRHGTGSPGTDPGTLDWTTDGLAERYADRVLAVLAARGTEVRQRVLWRVVRTPHDLERETRAPGGATTGPSLADLRPLRSRPANRSSVGGLFLVGGSAPPGGGLAFVGLSAAAVADRVGRA
ncbi:MAG TPA: phytoene desaturase family protein [Jiangellaceae bacterium]